MNWQNGALADGLLCYQSGQFFLAHEHWESVWLGLQQPQKSLLQALIQTTAALHHLHSGNRIGALSLLRKARQRIEPCPEEFCGILAQPLCLDLTACIRAIEGGLPPSTVLVPPIRPVTIEF